MNGFQNEVKDKMITALILFEYLQGEVSIGEVAEYYKKSIADTLDWINNLGIQTSRSMGQDLEKIGYENVKEELKERGITYP